MALRIVLRACTAALTRLGIQIEIGRFVGASNALFPVPIRSAKVAIFDARIVGNICIVGVLVLLQRNAIKDQIGSGCGVSLERSTRSAGGRSDFANMEIGVENSAWPATLALSTIHVEVRWARNTLCSVEERSFDRADLSICILGFLVPIVIKHLCDVSVVSYPEIVLQVTKVFFPTHNSSSCRDGLCLD